MSEAKKPLFVPLHVHSQYSILDASASVKAIAQAASEDGMPAVALTDHGNLFGAVDFYKACKEAKVKAIIGCEMYVAPGSRLEKKKEPGKKPAYHLTLLAKNEEGYHNLARLSSIGYLEGFYFHPRIDKELLKKESKGLVCLSGCMSSELSEAILSGDESRVLSVAEEYQSIFGEDYYFEIQRHPMSEADLKSGGMEQETWLLQKYHDFIEKQKRIEEKLLFLSEKMGIRYVATNDSHYMKKEDWRPHEILLNVQSGEPCEIVERDAGGNEKFRVPNPKRKTYPSHEFYFKTQSQMAELFSDLPKALETTLEIAEKCSCTFDFSTKHYPHFSPPGFDTSLGEDIRKKAAEDFLWNLCREGISKRYTEARLQRVRDVYPGKDPLEVVRERLDLEMDVIVPKGMCDYLLIVWDFIHWAKTSGIPVGPGRGSGAGSIVLYLIGVTDIEPLSFHLFFERFINPERISYPDIDVDICMERRQEVIQYTLNKYGKDSVAQIITFGTMKAKMAVKDVGRVLSVPLGKVNEIAKLIPEDLNITLEKALEKDHDLRAFYERDEEVRRVVDIGKRLEGSIRNTGIHAAGIIISGQALFDLIPVCLAKDADMPVTQYSMKPVEQVGMLKIDFLGLKTLTAIQKCVEAVYDKTGTRIDWVDLPLDDGPTFDLLNQGKTSGVFQLESGGMQDLARQLHLDRFEEIIAVGALYRPGPMDMIPSFISRKHGREAIDYDHPWMKDILEETYGIMVYQEQVMQIASKLAGFSLGEGDVLRRAMGKKDLKEMAKMREKFREGATKNGINETDSMRIFDKMEKFASYGFNKSHAAAYGYLSYVTAYMKANYPQEWMAALMSCDRDDLTKVAKFIHEAKSMHLSMLPPDINESGREFLAREAGIRFAMTGIRGVGEGVVESILEDKKSKGPFKDLTDFLQRIDPKKAGKKVVEQLIDAGAFDFTQISRDQLLAHLEVLFDTLAKEHQEKERGFLSLFSLMEEGRSSSLALPTTTKQRSPLELLVREKELLGFYITGHPLDGYRRPLEELKIETLTDFLQKEEDTVMMAAFLIDVLQTKIASKSQRKFAILKISDGGDETIELPIWSDLYDQKSFLLQENRLLLGVLQKEKELGGGWKYSCRYLTDLASLNEEVIAEAKEAEKKALRFKKRASKMVAQEVAPQEEAHVFFNAETLRHSHVMKIKMLLAQYSGKTPLFLKFFHGETHHATLHIGKNWFVGDVNELAEKLKEIPSFLKTEVKKIESAAS